MLQGLGPHATEREFGIPHSTAWRIAKLPKVQAYVEDVQAEAQRAVRRQAVSMAREALNELRAIGTDKDQPAPARVSALRAVLDIATPKRTELTGAGGGPLEVSTDQARNLIRAELASLPAADLGMPDPDDDEE